MIVAKYRTPHLGVGLYSLSEAARLLHAHPSKVLRWASEREGLVKRVFTPSEHTLTFLELMELHFIKMFRDEGVSLPVIRQASRTAAKRFNTDYPFSVKRFDTDGKTVFATLIDKNDDGSGVVVEDLRHGQYVFDKVVRPFFKKLDYHTALDEVARYWPREKSGGVVLDPTIKFGKPVVAAIGISTKALYDAFKAQKSPNKSVVAKWFDVPLSAVNAAVAFEQSVGK